MICNVSKKVTELLLEVCVHVTNSILLDVFDMFVKVILFFFFVHIFGLFLLLWNVLVD